MSEFGPQINPEHDAFRGDFENIHELQDDIRRKPEEEFIEEQNEFEMKTKRGFERLSMITKDEFVKIFSTLSAYDRFRITAVICTILSGQEDELSFERTGAGVPPQNSLENLKILEIGSFYGDAPDTEGYIEHAAANELAYYGVSEYTGIDLDEPKDVDYEEPTISGEVRKHEFVKMDAKNLAKRFPDRKWDMIFGNAFFGYPTKNIGKKGEINLLQTFSKHLRDGGVMWFKNNEKMLMSKEDIEELGFEYVDRDDLYHRLWAIRKMVEEKKKSE